MYIYKILNKINGKSYIGKTTKSLAHRWKGHLYDSKKQKTRLYNAIKKHGADNFEMYYIEYVNGVSIDKLNEREIYWIAVLEPEYNMTKGGDGGHIGTGQLGKHWKVKDTSRMRNKKTVTLKRIEGLKNITGGNNYQSLYFIYTPWGIYETWTAAITTAKQLKLQGRKDIICCASKLKLYCLTNILLPLESTRDIKRSRCSQWRGRHTKDLGFYTEVKVKHEAS